MKSSICYNYPTLTQDSAASECVYLTQLLQVAQGVCVCVCENSCVSVCVRLCVCVVRASEKKTSLHSILRDSKLMTNHPRGINTKSQSLCGCLLNVWNRSHNARARVCVLSMRPALTKPQHTDTKFQPHNMNHPPFFGELSEDCTNSPLGDSSISGNRATGWLRNKSKSSYTTLIFVSFGEQHPKCQAVQ